MYLAGYVVSYTNSYFEEEEEDRGNAFNHRQAMKRRRPGQFIEPHVRPQAKQASSDKRYSTKQRERSRIQIAGPDKGHSCVGGVPGAASGSCPAEERSLWKE